MKSALRFLRFILATLAWHSGYMLGRPFARDEARLRHRIFRGWSRSMARIAGMRVQVSGLPPAPPFLLVTNHLSYFDIALIAGQIDCVFVAKSQVAGWPLMGKICADMGTIFLKREDIGDIPRVSALIEAALARGEGVVLFPEGTSSPGAKVLPFNPPLLAAAARLGAPVHYAALSYAAPQGEAPAHLSVCWWGEMDFISHLRALFRLSGFQTILRFGPEPITDGNRKSLARRLHAGVSALFTPVVGLDTLARDRAQLEQQWTQHGKTSTSQRTSMS